MKSVATVIAGKSFVLNAQEINEVVDALSHSGAIVTDVKPLADEKAADIFFDVLPVDEAREILASLLENVPLDFIVQPSSGRRKKLLICDMDSTIIEQECIDEIADILNIKPKIADITARAMNGEIDFKDALRQRVMLLKGVDETDLHSLYQDKITFTEGAKTLVQTMKANGALCVLVSGGFTFFTSRVRRDIGFDIEEANILQVKEGKLTGQVREPILDSSAKLNALKFHCDDLGINSFASVAVGDGANDLPMLLESGLGIAFCAKPNVKKQVSHKIDIADLRHVLYAQGYRQEEMIN